MQLWKLVRPAAYLSRKYVRTYFPFPFQKSSLHYSMATRLKLKWHYLPLIVVYCPFPGYIANGKVMLMGNMGYYDYRPYVKKVTNNRQIMYECDRGYKLDDDGPPGATCVAGRWSPKQLPRCVAEQHSRGRWARSIKSGRTPVAIRPGGKKSSGKSTRRKQGTRRNDPDYDDGQQHGIYSFTKVKKKKVIL